MIDVVNPTPLSMLNDPFGIWRRSLPGGRSTGSSFGVPTSGAGLSPAGTTSGFNLNPQPTSGQGPFGAVPGQLGMPNPAGDLASQLPGLSGINSQASANILSKLKGELSKPTLDALKNTAAAYGVATGMPGSGLSSNAFLGNVAGAREAQTAQGIAELNALAGQTSQTQTVNPALQNEIASQNALNAAAPDPTQSNSFAMQLFQQYLSKMGGGNPAGGNRNFGGGMAIPQSAAPASPTLGSRYSAPAQTGNAGSYMTPEYLASPLPPLQFNDIAPQFNYQTSPWNTDLYGTKQDLPSDFYWE